MSRHSKRNEEGGRPGKPGASDSNHRITRVEGEIRDVIATYLLSHLRHEIPAMVSVTRVIVSKDLRVARVHITAMDPTQISTDASATEQARRNLQKSTVRSLQDNAYLIQEEVDRKLRMKFCPRLSFHYDEGFEEALKVESILQNLSNQRQKRQDGSGNPE